MIKLSDIRGRSALNLLETYSGYNPYILGLKAEYLRAKKLILTDNQSRYIIDNIDRDPEYMNRVVNITQYLGDELKNKLNLDFTPERILIEFMLAETEKAYHVYGKLTKKSESKLLWLPKTQVTDDPYFEVINVDVDFTKYNNILSKFNKKLYQHQEEGIKFLLSRNGCILADDMGLGKSIQSIIAAIESGSKNILIICPSSTKINWEREIKVFCDDTTIIEGKKFSSAKFTIINFDVLKNFHTLIKKGKESETKVINRQLVNAGYDLCIIDEAHYLKNNDSIRGKIVVELVNNKKIDKVWLLTGTPVANRPMDFFNLLKIINSPISQNWQHYATRYCEGRKFFRTLKNGQKRQIWLTDGASNLEELSSKTKNILLRRLKTDVLDMPDKIVTPMYHLLDSKQKQEYNELWENYILAKKELGKRVKEEQKDLVELILLRQFIANQAIPYTIEMVENAIEMGKKVVVFTSFTDELNTITNHFGKIAVKHNGLMTNTMKQKSVDAFQNNDKIKLFVGNIKSAGVGITLTEGTVVIFNSFDWVTGNNEQAEDRTYRIGQSNNVNIYYQLFDDTISTRMWETLKNKKDVILTIMGEKKLTDDEITEILIDNLYE